MNIINYQLFYLKQVIVDVVAAAVVVDSGAAAPGLLPFILMPNSGWYLSAF